MLVVGWERELLAETLEGLVDDETGPDRCDLEQDAAWLAEVDGAEVEPVDDRRRVRLRGGDSLLPGLVLFRRRCPGNVMDGAGSLDAGLGGRVVVGVRRAALHAAHLPRGVAAGLEGQRLFE